MRIESHKKIHNQQLLRIETKIFHSVKLGKILTKRPNKPGVWPLVFISIKKLRTLLLDRFAFIAHLFSSNCDWYLRRLPVRVDARVFVESKLSLAFCISCSFIGNSFCRFSRLLKKDSSQSVQ